MNKVDLNWKRKNYDDPKDMNRYFLYEEFKYKKDTLHLDNYYLSTARVEFSLDLSKYILTNQNPDYIKGWSGSNGKINNTFFRAYITPNYHKNERFMELEYPFNLSLLNNRYDVKSREIGKKLAEEIYQELFNKLTFASKSLKLRLSDALTQTINEI